MGDSSKSFPGSRSDMWLSSVERFSSEVGQSWDGQMVLMSGSLWKERRTWMSKVGAPMGNFYRFQLRFFALVGPEHPRLCQWENETKFRMKEPPSKELSLDGCSLSCASKHTGSPNSIGMFHPERTELYLLVPDRHQYRKWMQAMEGVLINPERLSLADFELVTLVGRGSFGQVFQARKKDTGRVFALKVLQKSFVRKHDQIENTKSERRVLEIVNHPYIVSLHYAFQTGSALCLVMDFVVGGELFMHLKQHVRFKEDDARIWSAEILLALEYLHSMDIVYRDIKPENILLDKEGHIKITDFGLAMDATDTVAAKTVAGSPYYMAPEVLLMTGHGAQADWWSLGILIYEMLVGLPPFYSQDARTAYQKLLTCPIEFPPHVSEAARDLIKNLLKTNPLERLGAGHSKKQQHHKHSDVLSEQWGDAMPIKTHSWYRGLRWDHVFNRQMKPSLVPDLRDDYDVSYFDRAFTSDTTWKNSALISSLVNAGQHPNDEEDFSNFAYVSKGHPIKSPGAHQPSMFIGQQKVPRMSLDKRRGSLDPLDTTRLSRPSSQELQRSPGSLHGGTVLEREGSEEMTAAEAQLHRGSLDLPPWSVAGLKDQTGRAGASNLEDEDWNLSLLKEHEANEYLNHLQYAKAGQLLRTKKGAWNTIGTGANAYSTPKQTWVRLVPSLGAILVYHKRKDRIPANVYPVPPATHVYPKRGVMQIGRQVFVYSIRIKLLEKDLTFLCESEHDRDEWVTRLRTVGERWRCGSKPGNQVVGMDKNKWKSMILSVFTQAKVRWEAMRADGSVIEMLSEVGPAPGHKGPVRYDGQAKNEVRHGCGIQAPEDPSDHEAYRTYYDGEWFNGFRKGHAMVKTEEGHYEGLYQESQGRHGLGRMTWFTGSIYDGGWVFDQRQGYGCMWWARCNEAHQGHWTRDMPNGQGIRFYPNGTIYEGGWKEGKQHGVGVLKHYSGDHPGESPRPESDVPKPSQSLHVLDYAGAAGGHPDSSHHSAVSATTSTHNHPTFTQRCIDGQPLEPVETQTKTPSPGSSAAPSLASKPSDHSLVLPAHLTATQSASSTSFEDAGDAAGIAEWRRAEAELEEQTQWYHADPHVFSSEEEEDEDEHLPEGHQGFAGADAAIHSAFATADAAAAAAVGGAAASGVGGAGAPEELPTLERESSGEMLSGQSGESSPTARRGSTRIKKLRRGLGQAGSCSALDLLKLQDDDVQESSAQEHQHDA